MLSSLYKSSKSYKKFMFFNFASTILVSVESVITTHNVLNGVSQDESSRTLNYVGRDVIGNMGSFLFVGGIGASADKDPKKFLQKVHVTQQLSYALTNIAAFNPNMFLLYAGSASTLISISSIGMGMFTAKCIQKLSSGDNAAEVYAHLALVNTFGASVGMMAGISLTSYINDPYTLMSLIPALAMGRVWLYNKAVDEVF
jgi:hypothetical protein